MPFDAPPAPTSKPEIPVRLPQSHLNNCRVIEHRDLLLEHLPTGGSVAELGVLAGDFSEKILRTCQPRQLFLIDVFDSVDWPERQRFNPQTHEQFIRNRFADEIQRYQVVLKRGLSWERMSQLPDCSFDWIYIDADHRYDGVKKDLDVSSQKVKEGGLLVMNDYIYHDYLADVEYGVVHAVNEFCVNEGWEVIFLALNEKMFNDVVLKKL